MQHQTCQQPPWNRQVLSTLSNACCVVHMPLVYAVRSHSTRPRRTPMLPLLLSKQILLNSIHSPYSIPPTHHPRVARLRVWAWSITHLPIKRPCLFDVGLEDPVPILFSRSAHLHHHPLPRLSGVLATRATAWHVRTTALERHFAKLSAIPSRRLCLVLSARDELVGQIRYWLLAAVEISPSAAPAVSPRFCLPLSLYVHAVLRPFPRTTHGAKSNLTRTLHLQIWSF